ncbi:MAG: hypothetical protein ACKO9Z_00430 [Planctomycetota bacterium]|nr:hypothetical protein [Planctomycetota bacterium]
MRFLQFFAMFLTGAAVTHLLPRSQAFQDAKPKAPEWKSSAVIAVRKAGENEVGPGTRRVGVEIFKDEATGTWLFVSETGDIAVAPAK